MVASPPVLVAAAALLLSAEIGRTGALFDALLFIGFAVLAPAALLVISHARGNSSDIELFRRGERLWPLLWTLAGGGIAVGLLIARGAGGELVSLGLEFVLLTGFLLVFTLAFKISVHCAAAALFGTVLWYAFSTPVPLLLLLPAVTWSRLFLRRHSPFQAAAGTALGVLVVMLSRSLLSGG
jgi:membrane-associated phospholipid phosphatase